MVITKLLIDTDHLKSSGENSPESPKNNANYESEQEKSVEEKREQEKSK